MVKVEDNGSQVVYRRGTSASWWVVFAMPVGMAIYYLLGGRDVMPYLFLGFCGVVMLVPAAFDEHFTVDTHLRAVIVSESFLGRVTRSETIPFAQVTRVAVLPNYSRERGKRNAQRDGFALMVDWTTPSEEGGMRLETYWEDSEVMAEAEKLARMLGTRVKRVEV
jgi:hypothetical protein